MEISEATFFADFNMNKKKIDRRKEHLYVHITFYLFIEVEALGEKNALYD